MITIKKLFLPALFITSLSTSVSSVTLTMHKNGYYCPKFILVDESTSLSSIRSRMETFVLSGEYRLLEFELIDLKDQLAPYNMKVMINLPNAFNKTLLALAKAFHTTSPKASDEMINTLVKHGADERSAHTYTIY